jgi:hypothetical protein
MTDEYLMKSALDALPPDPAAVIVDELASVNPDLLAQLRSTHQPTTKQRQAVNELLARAVVRSMGAEWVPNAHGRAGGEGLPRTLAFVAVCYDCSILLRKGHGHDKR